MGQEKDIEGSQSKEIGGKHTVGGALTKTNYPGFKVKGTQEDMAQDAYTKSQAEAKQKKMFEPWKAASGPEFYDGINAVKQDQ